MQNIAMSHHYKKLIESVGPLPTYLEEGLSTAVTRQLLYKSIPKKLRKRGEAVATKAAASKLGQQILKKGGAFTLPTRVASRIKAKTMGLRKDMEGK